MTPKFSGSGTSFTKHHRAVVPRRDRVGLACSKMLSPRQTTSCSPRRELACHADDLRDPAGLDLHLVGEVEVEEQLVARRATDVAVAEQVDELPGVLLAR